MLRIVESVSEKRRIQNLLEECVKKDWSQRESRTLVWRPSHANLKITHNGEYWFAAQPPDKNQKIKRYWNSVGTYSSNGNLQISLETNIPTNTNSKSVSGFFAIDEKTELPILMHDGAVGGGRKGIGKNAFLAWHKAELIEAYNSLGENRLGLIVAPIKKGEFGDSLARFVQSVIDFKKAVSNGIITPEDSDEINAVYSEYFDEFSGRKKGERKREIDYMSRHGDIVRKINEWRTNTANANEKIVKNPYIDLGVLGANGKLKEIYEIKTSTKRQDLYTGIGQILVHSEPAAYKLKRFLVLPLDGKIPKDVKNALLANKIKILRFEITKNNINISD